MMIEGLIPTAIFYLFASITILAALMVVASRNAVHSVLFLILAFFNAAGLFVLAGAEFIAMILVIVYVGAVAVLFLFVVMMLETSAPIEAMRKGLRRYTQMAMQVYNDLAYHDYEGIALDEDERAHLASQAKALSWRVMANNKGASISVFLEACAT